MNKKPLKRILAHYRGIPRRNLRTFVRLRNVAFNNDRLDISYLTPYLCKRLLFANVLIVDVSRILGHFKVSTTLDIYGHAMPENTRIIADKIANFVK